MNTVHEEPVSSIVAFFSLHTCGEACWYAKEDICRCYCNGKNHGCLKTPSGISPMRMAKIDGSMYQLKGIGKYGELLGQAKEINEKNGPHTIDKVTDTLTYRYFWHETDKGAPARVKTAGYDTVQRWPEFGQFKGLSKQEIFFKNGSSALYCLWVKL